MNLIEQFGGYEKVKSIRDINIGEFDGDASGVTIHYMGNSITQEDLEKSLLEYRRANGIFERHDLVVFKELPFERLFSVRHVGGDSIVIHEIWDEAGARSFSEDKPYFDIRHANDEEIAAGHRL